ncbi:hypothetical protein HMPREF9374_2712 [Desmospora sp. 8437]|nr:hypothetical protein HMPREF9374_2712 [Desmospora sp. 8437]
MGQDGLLHLLQHLHPPALFATPAHIKQKIPGNLPRVIYPVQRTFKKGSTSTSGPL